MQAAIIRIDRSEFIKYAANRLAHTLIYLNDYEMICQWMYFTEFYSLQVLYNNDLAYF